MPPAVLADSFAESKRLLKSENHQPVSIADQYRAIGQRLGLDFSPTIRLFDLLPIFLHGSRHAEVRRIMAARLANARVRQEQAAQRLIEQLPTLLAPGTTLDLVGSFVTPLWAALASADNTKLEIEPGLAADIIALLDSKSRLRDRMATNEKIRRFIALDPANADERLISLGLSVLGTLPLAGSITLSLHSLFSANLGKPLSSLNYPKRFPVSAIPVTDRVAVGHCPHAGSAAGEITRCVLHSGKYSTEENDELLYGVGEHACLGRSIANAVWSMITSALSTAGSTILSSQLALEYPAPQTDEDLLNMPLGFINVRALKVEIGA